MNQLHQLPEFEAALKDYHLSDEALQTLAVTKLVFLVGPSGGGRNTIIKELMKTGEYYFTVSDTTRQPRENDGVMEQNGREYWFRSEEDMLADITAGKFLEAEIIHGQQVSGTSIRELQKARDLSLIATSDADIGGVSRMLDLKPDAIGVLILPPSFNEWLKRFNGRGSLPAEEVKRRLETAVKIFKAGLQDDRLNFVVNDNYILAAERIHKLTAGEPIDEQTKAAAHALCEQLLQDTQAYLVSL
jgi:guanylate kinase